MWRKYTDTEKNYPCDKCDKIFSRRNSLVRHIAERRSEIEYKCEICEKIYWVKKGYIDFTPNIISQTNFKILIGILRVYYLFDYEIVNQHTLSGGGSMF